MQFIYKYRSGPWVSSISVMQELIINANSWPPPRPVESETWWGDSSLCLNGPSVESDALSC